MVHRVTQKLFLLILLCLSIAAKADGCSLWLRYDRISNYDNLKEYKSTLRSFSIDKKSPHLPAESGETISKKSHL